ncbi:MAG TPA: DUF3108 domain-containing protein [Bacteroidota bacterium]|nr:DUF3108 domain-containing protein [Bacteroidota bacterium]
MTGFTPAPGVRRACTRAAIVAALIIAGGTGLPPGGRAQDRPAPRDGVFVEGEELVYNVRYGFFDLGQVRIKVLATVRGNSSLAYQGKGFIDSYPKVPFADLHAVYESLIDSGLFSRRFIGRQKDNGQWDLSRYDFDYPARRVLIEVGAQDSVITRRDTLAIETPYHDGLSLFFYARAKLFSGLKVNVPTLIKEQKVNTYIDFKDEHTTVDLDAVDYPVDVVRFDGNMDFVGIFGLTGGFEGWFSNDEARVPIQAKMKVLIGSVTMELMKWTRPGWNPPRAKG